ncbi:MAG: putative actin patch assembly and actin polymerization protein [Thelocarpon impressellum]|nr:MAG: putative actin patch assembly and actin polymerization protein [Thelocarpon impressellum]
MFGGQKKPYTAITVQIEQLTSDYYDENDLSGIVDLIEVIRLQSSGPAEAARAIRKKLKYGSVHRQLRALTLLDGLVQNAGARFQRVFLDEPLLERLRFAATDPVSDAEVRAKCKALFGQWSVTYKDTPGMERFTALYSQLPQRKKPRPQQQSKVLRETEEEASRDPHEHHQPVSPSSSSFRPRAVSVPSPTALSPTTSSFSKGKDKDRKKTKARSFDLEKEKPQLLQTLASSSVASTNLLNALKLINRESKRVSEDPEVTQRFETCKVLRRQILRYIQHVESEQWLGGLIHANEELVTALMAYEVLDKSVEDDSDSEDEWDADDATSRARRRSSATTKDIVNSVAGLSIHKTAPPAPRRDSKPNTTLPSPPPRNGKGRAASSDEDTDDKEEEEDEDDPFADRNAVVPPKEV